MEEMSEFGFKYFFKVVDHYVIEGRLVAVSDITDPGDYKPGEMVELHRPDGSILTAQSFAVLFEEPAEKPFAMFFTNLTANDIPLGTEIWLTKERPVRTPSTHYERVSKSENC
ncbi:MAG: hypothetical protein WC028_15590 [Candidatus Obscuribacterales bacterium]